MADCERGLGKPKKAIELCMGDDAKHLTGEAKAEMFLVYAGALADLKLWNQAIEVVSKLVHAKGLAGEYRMRAAQAEQYFLEESGRSDEAVAMDELIDDLEDRYADVEQDETDDDFVVDYDVEDLPEDLPSDPPRRDEYCAPAFQLVQCPFRPLHAAPRRGCASHRPCSHHPHRRTAHTGRHLG